MLNDSNQFRNHLSKIELTLYFGLGHQKTFYVLRFTVLYTVEKKGIEQ
jgi:hypothetical protein